MNFYGRMLAPLRIGAGRCGPSPHSIGAIPAGRSHCVALVAMFTKYTPCALRTSRHASIDQMLVGARNSGTVRCECERKRRAHAG